MNDILNDFIEWTDVEETSGLPLIPLDYDFSAVGEVEMWISRIKQMHEWFKQRLEATVMLVQIFYPGIDKPEIKQVDKLPQLGDVFEGYKVVMLRYEVPTCEIRATIDLVTLP